MTRIEFLQLPEQEQNIFISKMLHAIRVKDICFGHASLIIELAEEARILDNVKFGNEVYKEADKDVFS